MTQHRLLPLPEDAWPEALADLGNTVAGRLNVYRTMAHHPALVRAWADLRQHVVRDTSLGLAWSEVVILRAATGLNAAYEWDHHLSRARAIGFDDARIASLRGPLKAMAPDDAVLSRAVDEAVGQSRLSPGTLTALSNLVGKQGVLDLFATVGFYTTLALIVNTFATPLDPAVAAENAARPLQETAP